MTFAKLSNRKAQILRYFCRRDRFKSNLARRQVRKKVAGVAAIVVNCNSIISLSRQSILKPVSYTHLTLPTSDLV